MAVFTLKASDEFSLRVLGNDRRLRAMEHPSAPDFVHGMEGGKAKVYRVRDLATGVDDYALKVMKVKHQDPALEVTCARLDGLKSMPGLAVCERVCLTPLSAPEALQQYRSLQYAILMPWIQGETWFDVLNAAKSNDYMLSRQQSLLLAATFAQTIAGLEKAGIAHCDLSPGNVIVDLVRAEVQLIDVEDIYSTGFPKPAYVSQGTQGYQHQTSSQGQWHPSADRFAGAILLAEMLGWFEQSVRSASYGESFFDPFELQAQNCPRLQVLSNAVAEHHPCLAALLTRAWASGTLDDCASFAEWHQALSEVQSGVVFKPLCTDTLGNAPSRRPFWVTFKPSLAPSAPRKPSVSYQPLKPTSPPQRRGETVEWVGGAGTPADKDNKGHGSSN